MNKSSKQNPILVIATLGVYFGLMLAGATPQVLASAAMTRQFDVKDEIEMTDDLDTKPDDERSPVTASVQIYLEDVEYFLSNIAKLKNSGKFDPALDTFSVAQNTLLPCVDSNLAGRYTPIRFVTSNEGSRSTLEYFSRGMVYGYSLGDCVANSEFAVKGVESKFDFTLDLKHLNVNVNIRKDSPDRALDLVRQLRITLSTYAAATSKFRQAVVKHTTFKAQNDQVFVVTRLPRAGLVELLSAQK